MRFIFSLGQFTLQIDEPENDQRESAQHVMEEIYDHFSELGWSCVLTKETSEIVK